MPSGGRKPYMSTGYRSGPSHAGGSLPGAGVGVKRTSYPSGSWVDAYGNPAASPNAPYYTPAAPAVKMPDPNNWKVIKASERGGYLLLQIQYPDCTNYEGNKIMVFRGVSLIDLVNQQKAIDPHFFKDGKAKSPIARFEPTPQGWKMAEIFIDAWLRSGHTLR